MTFFPVTTRYPPGPITPVGSAHLLRGDQPMVAYRSYNDAVVFNLMGPMAIFDRTMPETVRLLEMTGLMPPWKNIMQKGATQDGSSYITSLYDPLDGEIVVQIRGRDPMRARKVIRDWIDSWDAKKPGTLSWLTPELGYWWAKVRFAKPPPDKFQGGSCTRQKMKIAYSSDDAFWRSYDTTDVFGLSYLSAVETFNFDTTSAHGLGSNWTVNYINTATSGAGYLYADGTQCLSTLTNGRAAAARYITPTGSDEQIVTLTIGPIDPWPAATNVYLDLWARMDSGGPPGQTGVRCRLGYHPSGKGGTGQTPFVRLSYFVGGAETILRQTDVTIPWKPTDQISLAVGGYSGSLYSYYVQRGTNSQPGANNKTWSTLMTVLYNSPDGSQVGSAYRGIGFGMEADATSLPPSVKMWTGGDTTAAEEAGYVTLYNAGDQDMWPYYILVGPGEFGIGDGPNATQAVTYGPLLENQVVLIRTDPRRYSVTDLTSMPPPGTPVSSQLLSSLEAALEQYNAFLSNSSVPPPHLSAFGVNFPQGNPYSLLRGRFSRPIPAKQPGVPVAPAQIAIAVASGSHTTAVLAGGTPLRRYPG